MKKSITFLWILLSVNIYSQEVSTKDLLEKHVSFLASDEMKGRKPGTAEIEKAAEYIRSYFEENNLILLGNKGFQDFDVVTSVKLDEGNSLFINDFHAKIQEDNIPFPFSGNGTLNANVVFVGYGFDLDEGTTKWNDYEGVDVKDKWALILRASPEENNPHSPFENGSNIRAKVNLAMQKGAKGVLMVSGKKTDEKDVLFEFKYGRGTSQLKIPVLHIKRVLADKIIDKATNKTILELENQLISEKKPISFDTKSIVNATVNIRYIKATTKNIVAMIKGSENPDEYLVIGGHYDHLGMGGHNSGSRMPDTIAVHNGADDNASGTASVMELARLFSKNPPKRSIIFVAFSAEEMGLLGSAYFTANPPVDYTKIYAMLNLDMVARPDLKKPVLHIAGTGTAEEFNSILDSLKSFSKLPLAYIPDGFGASDQSSFYTKNTPVLFFYTSLHEDYHTPFDDVEKLDLNAHADNTNFAYQIALALVNRTGKLTYKEVAGKYKRKSRGYKITFGIVPAFGASDVEGLRVDGVREGGPAKKAGMQKGDIIIEVEGEKIANIYDYMDQLNKLKKGQAVRVVVQRKGAKKKLTIQL